MIRNVGSLDTIVRLVLFVVFTVIGVLNIATGFWWIGLFGLVFLFTGLTGYCPIWHALKINTSGKKQE